MLLQVKVQVGMYRYDRTISTSMLLLLHKLSHEELVSVARVFLMRELEIAFFKSTMNSIVVHCHKNNRIQKLRIMSRKIPHLCLYGFDAV